MCVLIMTTTSLEAPYIKMKSIFWNLEIAIYASSSSPSYIHMGNGRMMPKTQQYS